MRIALFLGLSITISACALQTPPQAGPIGCEINPKMARLLEREKDGFFYKGVRRPDYKTPTYDIIHNLHPELVMHEKGKLRSRNANWKLNLHYNVSELAEDSEIILLESGPNVWGMWPGDTMLLVLRKRDGYILRWARVDGRVSYGVARDGAFYYFDNEMELHCISLRPERN